MTLAMMAVEPFEASFCRGFVGKPATQRTCRVVGVAALDGSSHIPDLKLIALIYDADGTVTVEAIDSVKAEELPI